MIYGRIRRCFTAHSNLTVGNITSKDIEDFYEWMFESGVVGNTVIHYHTVLHSAFKRAFKDELIDANPFDRIDRPKKNKFTGENYSEDVRTVASLLGHAQASTTLDIYAHAFDKNKRKAQEKLGKAIGL